MRHSVKNKVVCLAKSLEDRELKQQKIKIMDILNKDTSLVPATLRLLESGTVKKMASRCMEREIPESCNKISLLSKKFLSRAVVEMSGGLYTHDMFKRWEAGDELVVMHLFLFALGEKRDNWVSPTPMLESHYSSRLKLRARALGDRLQALTIHADKVEWEKCGVYTIIADEAGKQTIKHKLSGVEVPKQAWSSFTLLAGFS
jgi:hypothetical protein